MPIPKARILCVEDDTDNRELARFTLTEAGFEAICTDSAERLLDLARMEKFDLYLLDNWGLGISGEELCKKIRKFDLKTPILFYSGAAYDTDKARAYAAGAQGYLLKPVLGDDLVKEVARLIVESNNEPRAQTPTPLS